LNSEHGPAPTRAHAHEHQPVLLAPAIAALNIDPAGCYLDATFGRGGHTRAILAQLDAEGRVIAIDRDPHAVAVAPTLGDPRVCVVHARFSQMRAVLKQLGVERVDGVLMDLGVSSPQLEDAQRGFSFRRNGPLDMRMNPEEGLSAAQWLAQASEQQLTEVIERYGEERFAKQIARAIVAAAQQQPIRSTRELAQIVAKAVRTREPGQDPATRTFQALRIFINQELEELEVGLAEACDLLAPGGRLVVISFHSLEDRMVKHFLQKMARGHDLPPRLPVRADSLPPAPFTLLGKAQRASDEEIVRNPRARSAIMRVAEKARTLSGAPA
jgi:16S rRNA (cytosine1402-N4)-methyltransferase